ncbi:MAG: RNA polymerase sigma factor [Candidatus Dormibacteria bacterium]
MIALQLQTAPSDHDEVAPEVRQLLRDLLAELPEPYSSVLSLVELEGISIADAASHLELREASVRLLYREGRRRLRGVVMSHAEAGLI